MIEAQATARYVRTSAQKAGLVLDLIRGRDVNHALATLQFTRKGIASEVAKVLRSAIANAQQKEGVGGDIDRLYVTSCYANQGPSMKRIRPAPMGRAFRVVKRSAHLTVKVAERPVEIAAVAAGPAAPKSAGGKGASGTDAKAAAPAKARTRVKAAARKRTARAKAKKKKTGRK
jgi:large subunit ribosomal protein L22